MKIGAFDIIGTIAILPLFTRNPKKIARKLMAESKHIKSVYMKAGKISGRLRKNNLKFILGEKTKETVHRESGCSFKLDIEKCYFSPRLGNDRIDVCKQIKPGEKVLVMFGGIGPYAIVIAKNSKAQEVYSIELNKIATNYAKENVRINKLNNVIVLQGDVKKVLPKLKIKFNRIMMARPQLKDDFLDSALKVSKKGTVIHFHDFLKESEMPNASFEKIKTACKKAGKKFKIIRWKKALEVGLRKWRIRVDFKVF
jgi:tRNA (guanine37-N1)-methyltransferase